jgi:hypothetical protein
MYALNSASRTVSDPPDFLNKLKKLDDPCLDKVRDRLKATHLWSEEEANDARRDFIRFAALTYLRPPGMELVPTKKIDAFWHTFLIFTQMYQKWCNENWGQGWFLHHVPGHKGDGSWEATRDLALDVYGVEWQDSAMADSCGCNIPPPEPAGR